MLKADPRETAFKQNENIQKKLVFFHLLPAACLLVPSPQSFTVTLTDLLPGKLETYISIYYCTY